jgi:hypothetical protein
MFMSKKNQERESIILKADNKDRKALLNMLEKDQRIKFKSYEPKSTDVPVVISIISGFLAAIEVVLAWYEIRKKEQVDVEIRRKDGTTIKLNTISAKKLKLLIEEKSTD